MFVILFVCICSWTSNHFASEAIGHYIRSQIRGPYHHYDAMLEEDKLKWWTDFQVILIFNKLQSLVFLFFLWTQSNYFLLFNRLESLGHAMMNAKLKRSTSLKSKKDFVIC